MSESAMIDLSQVNRDGPDINIIEPTPKSPNSPSSSPKNLSLADWLKKSLKDNVEKYTEIMKLK